MVIGGDPSGPAVDDGRTAERGSLTLLPKRLGAEGCDLLPDRRQSSGCALGVAFNASLEFGSDDEVGDQASGVGRAVDDVIGRRPAVVLGSIGKIPCDDSVDDLAGCVRDLPSSNGDDPVPVGLAKHDLAAVVARRRSDIRHSMTARVWA